MARKPRPKNSAHRPEREATPYKRVKRKVYKSSKEVIYLDDDWVPLSELLREDR